MMVESMLTHAQARLSRIVDRADACVESMEARRRLARQAQAALRRRLAGC